MQKQSTKSRKGDTSRTSNQGRKYSYGDDPGKTKGNREINEDTKNTVKEEQERKKKHIPGAKK